MSDLKNLLDEVRSAIRRELPEDVAIDAMTGVMTISAAMRRVENRTRPRSEIARQSRLIEVRVIGNRFR